MRTLPSPRHHPAPCWPATAAALRHLQGFARALLVFSLGRQDYLNLLLATVLSAVALVMVHAAALADEHAQFV